MHHINEAFVCIVCQHQVDPASVSCRNHCPYCFASLHVDQNIPGDRGSGCHGVMLPQSYHYHPQSIDIHFVCIKCGHTHTNKQAPDDQVQEIDYLINHYRYAIHTGKMVPLQSQ